MTCIAAIVHRGEVYMAGDSAVSCSSGLIQINRRPKVFRRGTMILGMAGECRLADLVEFGFRPPDFDGGDLTRYLAIDFANGLRGVLRDAGHIKVEDGQDNSCGSILFGMTGRIFDMSHDFCLVESAGDYAAIGSGAEVALGSLHATAGRDPIARLMRAMRAAQCHRPDVREPFTVVGPVGWDQSERGIYGHRPGLPIPEAVP